MNIVRIALGVLVGFSGVIAPLTARAEPITVLGTFNFLDVRSANTAGVAIGSRNSFGLDVTPNPRTGDSATSVMATRTLSEFTPNPPLTLVYLDSPALPNQYALSFPCGTPLDPCGIEGLGPAPWWLRGPWRFTITNPNSPNTPVVVDSDPLEDVVAPPFVTSMAISPGPTPTQPKFSWTYPDIGIFDGVAIFIMNLDDRIGVGNSARIIHVDFGVPLSVNTYEVPQMLSGGGGLQAGVHYTVSIQLTRRRPDGSLWARSAAFFDFLLDETGPTVTAFLPTVGPDGVYHFNVGPVEAGAMILIDPQVAVGYDYAIGVGDPNFASVMLPQGIGDGQYALYLFDAAGQPYKVADVAAGVPFAFAAAGFSDGVDRFRVLGIEVAAALDPRNATAFVTGVSFVDAGRFTGTMTPITANVVAFQAFEAKAEFKAGSLQNRFELTATFAVGLQGDSVHLLTEDVSFRMGPLVLTIPAGSFTSNPKRQRWEFRGTLDGVPLEVTIGPASGGRLRFAAEGWLADFTGFANPLPVALSIGDDVGTTVVTGEFK